MNVWPDFRTDRAKKSHVRKPIDWNSNCRICTEKLVNVIRRIFTFGNHASKFHSFPSKSRLRNYFREFYFTQRMKYCIYVVPCAVKKEINNFICINFYIQSCRYFKCLSVPFIMESVSQSVWCACYVFTFIFIKGYLKWENFVTKSPLITFVWFDNL